MENTKIDISSTLIEKGIDSVKGFIEKLAGSTLEEAGLMFGDKVRVRRLKNQIKIFSEVKKITEENNITLKEINLKTLVPLLEFSSLEEDETLQEKWANLIVNFSDANEKYESSIYPSILNQLSRNEVIELDRLKDRKRFDYKHIMLKEVEKSNITRLGLIEKYISDGTFLYLENEEIPVLYLVTEIGKDFIKCCSSRTV